MAELRKSPPLSLAFMTQTEQLLRFLSLVPYLSPSGKRPRRNQRRTKERPKNSESIEVRFVKINKHIYPPLLILKQALYVWNFETFQLKICTSANFVVPLQPNPTLEGNMSCEQCFAKVLSKGRFLTY